MDRNYGNTSALFIFIVIDKHNICRKRTYLITFHRTSESAKKPFHIGEAAVSASISGATMASCEKSGNPSQEVERARLFLFVNGAPFSLCQVIKIVDKWTFSIFLLKTLQILFKEA